MVASWHYKVALLTNNSLLNQSAVRSQVKDVDVVMASLDVANKELFRRINRSDLRLGLDSIIDGIIAFRNIFPGRLLMEYFVVKGLNDSLAA
jgi:wyosine [tRNA(Phe)-imidazoG37] synthetase (radical SAM superfamily)